MLLKLTHNAKQILDDVRMSNEFLLNSEIIFTVNEDNGKFNPEYLRDSVGGSIIQMIPQDKQGNHMAHFVKETPDAINDQQHNLWRERDNWDYTQR